MAIPNKGEFLTPLAFITNIYVVRLWTMLITRRNTLPHTKVYWVNTTVEDRSMKFTFWIMFAITHKKWKINNAIASSKSEKIVLNHPETHYALIFWY